MSGRLLTLPDGRYAVESDDREALSSLRELPGAEWCDTSRQRTVSSSPFDLDDLIKGVEELGYEIPPAVYRRRRETPAVPSCRRRRETLGEASRASGCRLYPYQREGVRWLRDRARAVLADEMGLGKTPETLLSLPDGARAVVVCPATLKPHWASETRRWRPDLTPTILSGLGSFRPPRRGEVVILNYEILPSCPGKLPLRTVAIADEAHLTKTPWRRRTMAWAELAYAALDSGGKAWALTGTPLLNRPSDLWQILANIGLARETFVSFRWFRELFDARDGGYEIIWGKPKPLALALLRRVMLRRTRRQVLPGLPGKRVQVLPVSARFTSEDRRLCDRALEAWNDAGNPRVLPAFEDMSAVREALSRAKIPALIELVESYEDAQEPLVVFSDHVAPVVEVGSREGWAAITGDTPPAQRAAIVQAFQAGGLRGLALTITAGGLGLTLTRAAHAVFCGLNWVPANNVQAEDRLCRIGQARGCVYTVIEADHELDRRINEVLGEKTELFLATMPAVRKSA
jgi:SNF2 family DNA or RNA helicase